MKYADSDYLKYLSAYIRPQIGLPFEDCEAPLDQALANFAVRRHRVGALLHKASNDGLNQDNIAAAILSASYDKNIRSILAQKAASQNLMVLLNEQAIPFSFLKGLGIADQIYGDPQTRQSKDIDILIPPEAASSAIQLLAANGYSQIPYSIRKNRPVKLKRQLSDLKLFKDLTFIDPKYSIIIELHQRLFKIEPKNLTAGFNAAIKFQPIPSVLNSHYCLYIILHGAAALWPRLKWLVDLSLLARKISPPDRRDLLKLARIYGCEKAVVASLWFVDDIFVGSLDTDWNAILGERKHEGETQALIAVFRKSLMTSSPDRPERPAKRDFFFAPAPIVFGRQISILKTIWRRIAVAIAIRI